MYANTHTDFFSQTGHIKITHTDLTWSSVSVEFKGKRFNFCPWHWKRSSERREEREKQ